MGYNTFICYRKKNGGAMEASENVAGMLYWWLKTEQACGNVSPILFEECYISGNDDFKNLNFMSDVSKVMKDVKSCYVVICKGFFNKILDTYTSSLGLYAGDGFSEDELRAKALKELETIPLYNEIRCALDNANTTICPLFVNDGDESAIADLHGDGNKKVILLNKIFGEKITQLLHRTNTPQVDYAHIRDAFQNFSWNTAEEDAVAAVMKQVENTQTVQMFWKGIREQYGNQKIPTIQSEADIRCRIQKDLRLCAKTISARQQPAKNDRKDCRASNDEMIYDPVFADWTRCQTKTTPFPLLAACLLREFNKNRSAFGLTSDTFRYWNVDMQHEESDNSGLSVCAICFGTLSMYHRLYKDSQNIDGGKTDRSLAADISKTIASGINLLLTVRNPYTKTWPSSWSSDQSIGVEGTLNQTTLSLSTLISCGFLSAEKQKDPTRLNECDSSAQEQKDLTFLKNRYRFVWESIEVLINMTESFDDGDRYVKAWPYTEDSTAPALLPTIFVFDTFAKMRQCITELQQTFAGQDLEFTEQLEENAAALDEELGWMMAFIEGEQKENGAFIRNVGEPDSVTHTAYVVKSLCQYMHMTTDVPDVMKQVVNRGVAYLVKRANQMMKSNTWHLNDDYERFEHFCAPEPPRDAKEKSLLKSNHKEKYEHCAELILAEALIKAAMWTDDKEMRQQILKLLRWVFVSYVSNLDIVRDDERDFNTRDDFIKIPGHNKNLKYPIYYLYYYRMFLWDYLLLLEAHGSEATDE